MTIIIEAYPEKKKLHENGVPMQRKREAQCIITTSIAYFLLFVKGKRWASDMLNREIAC